MPKRRCACLFALLALAGCGSPPAPPTDPNQLLHGSSGPIPLAQLDAARAVAGRFASAYADSIYDPDPPTLPGATEAVNRAILSAAARIPPPRIGRRAAVGAPSIAPESSTRIRAAVRISDGRSPPFSVGFTLALRDGRWLVTAISPPG